MVEGRQARAAASSRPSPAPMADERPARHGTSNASRNRASSSTVLPLQSPNLRAPRSHRPRAGTVAALVRCPGTGSGSCSSTSCRAAKARPDSSGPHGGRRWPPISALQRRGVLDDAVAARLHRAAPSWAADLGPAPEVAGNLQLALAAEPARRRASGRLWRLDAGYVEHRRVRSSPRPVADAGRLADSPRWRAISDRIVASGQVRRTR